MRLGRFFVVALVVATSCEFGVAPEEGGARGSGLASQAATLEGEASLSPVLEGTATWGAQEDPVQTSGGEGPVVPTTSSQCVPTVSGLRTWPCLPVAETGDRSHGDPQPWQPSPVPQPY